jgi:hypothetical protein
VKVIKPPKRQMKQKPTTEKDVRQQPPRQHFPNKQKGSEQCQAEKVITLTPPTHETTGNEISISKYNDQYSQRTEADADEALHHNEEEKEWTQVQHSPPFLKRNMRYLVTSILLLLVAISHSTVMVSRIPDSHLQSPIRTSLRSFFTRPSNKTPRQFISLVDSCPVRKDLIHQDSECAYGLFLSKIYDEDIQISEWASDTYVNALDAANDVVRPVLTELGVGPDEYPVVLQVAVRIIARRG